MAKKRYLKKISLGLILLVSISIGTIYIWSAIILNKTYPVPLATIHVPTDMASIKEGERLLRIEHCGDCHGEQLSGRTFEKIDNVTQLVAPNITAIIPAYSNEELERLIRHGIKRNGKSVYFMPSPMYYHLKDEAIAKIIAYLRTLKPISSSPGLPASIPYYPLGRLKLIQGEIKAVAEIINHTSPRIYAKHDTTQIAFGKYLTMTACSNCHGKDLKGGGDTPDLIIATAYSKEQFIHLLKTGEGGLGRKDLGLMSIMGKNHLSYLNEKELDAIYAFLKTSPSQKK